MSPQVIVDCLDEQLLRSTVAGTEAAVRALSGGHAVMDRSGERWEVPRDVGPCPVEVLVARREVIRLRRRERRLAQRLGKPVFVNTVASCRDELAGLVYVSASFGSRVELIACGDSTLAEHLALLMAMRDAVQVLAGGSVVFRVDCAAVTTRVVGGSSRLENVRREIGFCLAENPDWTLVLVDRLRNRVAHAFADRAFRVMLDGLRGGCE
jgi:hypothetical protein